MAIATTRRQSVVETSAEPSSVLRRLRKAFVDPQDVIGRGGSGRFVVLHKDSGSIPAIDLECSVGVGGRACGVPALHDSYVDASTALYLAARLPGSPHVVHIDDLRVHELVAASGARSRLVRALIGPLREQPDWPVLRSTTVQWCESGFNLVRAAAALSIHRNTLIYRLGKIEEAGLPVRNPRAALKLYLACIADALDS